MSSTVTTTREADTCPDVAAPSGSRDGVRAGVRDGVMVMLPLIAAYAPFAMVIGATVAAHGTPLAGWAGSWLIFGGSAHLATIRTLDTAGPVVAVLTGLLVNARLLVYSASLAQHWRGQPRWFKLAAAGMIIDPTWAVAERHAEGCTDDRTRRGFFLGAGLTLGVGWSVAMAIGVIARARLDWLDLDIVVPLCLLALVGAGLRTRSTFAVIVVAASTAVITSHFPAGTGLLLAIAAGVATGMGLDRRTAS